jgi:hypothetical protein
VLQICNFYTYSCKRLRFIEEMHLFLSLIGFCHVYQWLWVFAIPSLFFEPGYAFSPPRALAMRFPHLELWLCVLPTSSCGYAISPSTAMAMGILYAIPHFLRIILSNSFTVLPQQTTFLFTAAANQGAPHVKF